nr:SusC/RagA family TonB-linked outer membrane protein [Gemmatimonadota bacterium]
MQKRQLAGVPMLFGLILARSPQTYAQEGRAERVVSGVVQDQGTGEPLPGAIVNAKGAANSSMTARDGGRFSLSLPAGNTTLVVRKIGYRMLELPLPAGVTSVVARMIRDPLKLDDIVVTGHATGVARRNAANAVTVLGSEDLTRAPSSYLESALQGKIPGAQIYKSTGAPGGGTRVIIRGSGSINGDISPLYVIDGVIVSDAAFAPGLDRVTRSGGGGFAWPTLEDPVNRIADINPDQIEDIEILKGSSASALYGSKASGGVILITTKRGKVGSPKLTSRSSIGTSQLSYTNGLRRFESLALARRVYDPQNTLGDSAWAALFSPDRFIDHEQILYGEKPISYEQSLSLSGGSEATRYYLSGMARRDNGIVRNTFADKKGFRANFDHSFGSRLQLALGSDVTRSTGDRGLFGNENAPGGGSVAYAIPRIPSFHDLRLRGDNSYPENRFWTTNPYQTIDLFENREAVWRTVNSARFTLTPLSTGRHELRFIANGGIDLIHQRNNVYAPPEMDFERQDGLLGTAVLSEFRNLSQTLNLNALHLFTPRSGLSITSQVGTQYEAEDSQIERARGENLIGGIALPSAGTVRDFTTSMFVVRDFGLFAQSEALIGEHLLLTLGARADRSTNNGNAQKFYFFPKASASYALTSGDVPGFQELKFRIAYGETGNRPFSGDKFTTLGFGLIGGLTGLTISGGRGSPDIRPERQRELEGGLDAVLFDSRASIELTGYQRNISDLLLDRTVPPSLGFSVERVNGGELRLRGVEAVVNLFPLRSANLSWSSRLSIARNRSEVISLLEPLAPFGSRLIDGQVYVQVGHSLTEMIGADTVRAAGVCPDRIVDPATCVGAAVG